MPFLPEYLLKVSISLVVVYLFYRVALRRLTFYTWNRFYLMGYSLLSFLIPFIDISLVLEKKSWSEASLVQWVPVISDGTLRAVPAGETSTTSGIWILPLALLLAGMGILLFRLLIQWLSYRKMLGKARLIEDGNMRIYRVEEQIIPFSFGRSIFINPSLHSEAEIREIILHEIVHARQRHSVDIIWSELLCIFNWYNPFAWMIRAAIRQNLEFIADQKVLEQGIDRKQYQYLLLKVIGNEQFSIATKFNFSSLKKRIAMMNKMRSAGLHLLKFLFLLPIVAVLLLAFRNREASLQQTTEGFDLKPVLMTDTVAPVALNSKGYYLDVIGVDGECFVVVRDKNRKEVEKVSLNTWKENASYGQQYGEIPAPSTPVAPVAPVTAVGPIPPNPPLSPLAPIVSSCDHPVATAVTPTAVGANTMKNASLVKEFEITKTRATMHMKDGSTEEYDLTNKKQRADFEKKYGKIHETGTTAPVVFASGTGTGATAITAPPLIAGTGMAVHDPRGAAITGGEDIIITISNTTTKAQLDAFVQQMKVKGVELKFENVDFNDGLIVSLSGYMKKKDSRSDFTVTDFKTLTLAITEVDGKVWLKVSTKDQNVVI